MVRAIRRFLAGFMLPLTGSRLLLHHRHLLALAIVPLMLNLVLYIAALVLVMHYYEDWFGLLFARPQAWYLLAGYVILRFIAFILLLAVLVFSFVFVGTALAAPFLDILSAQVEHVLQDQEGRVPVRPSYWLMDCVRALGHTILLLIVWIGLLPLSFLPGLGHALWLMGSW